MTDEGPIITSFFEPIPLFKSSLQGSLEPRVHVLVAVVVVQDACQLTRTTKGHLTAGLCFVSFWSMMIFSIIGHGADI